MPGVERQRLAFEFFSNRFESQEPFTMKDLSTATGWTGSTLRTYWLKQFRGFAVEVSPGRFRVGEAFRPFATWDGFQGFVTQVRAAASSDYERYRYDNVLIYEFFMPLTNETELRGSLDSLFFKDAILRRLRACRADELKNYLAADEDETHDEYLERICDWIAGKFVGYSISHVSGRFRAEELATYEQAADIQKRGRYLIDETTAITRFIFPCEDAEDAERISWFFSTLFVESIIEVVHGEAEIWMVESGIRNSLHIWRVKDR